MRTSRFEIVREAPGRYSWRLFRDDGALIAISPTTFESVGACLYSISSVMRCCAEPPGIADGTISSHPAPIVHSAARMSDPAERPRRWGAEARSINLDADL